MNKKYIGIVFIIIGTVLVAWGYNTYDSVGAQISRGFNGDAPIEAWIGMLGGGRHMYSDWNLQDKVK